MLEAVVSRTAVAARTDTVIPRDLPVARVVHVAMVKLVAAIATACLWEINAAMTNLIARRATIATSLTYRKT